MNAKHGLSFTGFPFIILALPLGKKYRVVTNKKHFFQTMDTLSTVFSIAPDKISLNIEIERKPGYVFDVTIAEAKIEELEDISAGVLGARIEV